MFDRYAPLIPDVVALHGRWRRDWPAIVSQDGTLSWAAFDRQTNRIANKLIAAGGHRGDRVALVMSNGLAMMEIMVGIMKAGCVVVPLNPSSADSVHPCHAGRCWCHFRLRHTGPCAAHRLLRTA